MVKLLDEFVNTEEFKAQACAEQEDEDEPQLSGHVLTVAGRHGAYFGRVNNLMWISVFLLDRPLSVFLLERPESADYEDMYQTFYILTGCHDGAKYFTDLL